MLGMDQFKDLRGYARYAARLPVGAWQALGAWLGVAYNALLGGIFGRVGPQRVRREACDPDLVDKHLGRVLPSSSS